MGAWTDNVSMSWSALLAVTIWPHDGVARIKQNFGVRDFVGRRDADEGTSMLHGSPTLRDKLNVARVEYVDVIGLRVV